MRITQAFVPSSLHASGFHKKFSLSEYKSIHEPTCFFGAHVSVLDKIRQHKGHKTLIWIGMDGYNMSIGKHDVEFVRTCRNIATSRSLQRVLDSNDVENEYYPISCFEFKDIVPEPLGDKIYFYHGRKDLYQYDLMKRVADRVPFKVIWVDGWQAHSREDIFHLYQECFCGVRLREIDGLSNTGIELGLMGRMVIHNGDMPNNISYTDEDSIVNEINHVYDFRSPVNDVSEAVRNFIDIGDDWLNF